MAAGETTTPSGPWAAPQLADTGARLVPGRVGPAPSWPSLWAGTTPAFLEHLLRATLCGPGAEGEPAAGRLAAEVLVALAEAGAAGEAAWALPPRPGVAAVFEVRSFSSGSLDPFEPFGTDDPNTAILVTRDRARDAGRSVELVSRDERGLQRSVLTQHGPGALTYRFAELACLEAPQANGGELTAVVEAWRLALTPVAAPAPPVAAPGTAVSAEAIANALLTALVVDGRALRTYDVADVLASLIPTPGDVADLVVERLVGHFEGDPPEPQG